MKQLVEQPLLGSGRAACTGGGAALDLEIEALPGRRAWDRRAAEIEQARRLL
jgi:hypothetical protein